MARTGDDWARIATGFAVAPLASGLLQALVGPIGTSVFVVMIAYLATLLVGLPAFLVARRFGRPGVALTVSLGAAFAALAYLVVLEFVTQRTGRIIANLPGFGVAWFAMHGALVAGCFWLIALGPSAGARQNA